MDMDGIVLEEIVARLLALEESAAEGVRYGCALLHYIPQLPCNVALTLRWSAQSTRDDMC